MYKMHQNVNFGLDLGVDSQMWKRPKSLWLTQT